MLGDSLVLEHCLFLHYYQQKYFQTNPEPLHVSEQHCNVSFLNEYAGGLRIAKAASHIS